MFGPSAFDHLPSPLPPSKRPRPSPRGMDPLRYDVTGDLKRKLEQDRQEVETWDRIKAINAIDDRPVFAAFDVMDECPSPDYKAMPHYCQNYEWARPRRLRAKTARLGMLCHDSNNNARKRKHRPSPSPTPPPSGPSQLPTIPSKRRRLSEPENLPTNRETRDKPSKEPKTPVIQNIERKRNEEMKSVRKRSQAETRVTRLSSRRPRTRSAKAKTLMSLHPCNKRMVIIHKLHEAPAEQSQEHWLEHQCLI